MDSSIACSSVSLSIEDKDFFNSNNLNMYQHNLVGLILNFLVFSQSPMSFQDIVTHASNFIHLLRKADGSLYSSNLTRCINSVLNCSKVFWKMKNEDGQELFWFHESKAKAMLISMESKTKSKKIIKNLKKITKKADDLAHSVSDPDQESSKLSIKEQGQAESQISSQINNQNPAIGRKTSDNSKPKSKRGKRLSHEIKTKMCFYELTNMKASRNVGKKRRKSFDFSNKSEDYKTGFLDCFSFFQTYIRKGISNSNTSHDNDTSLLLIESMIKQVNLLNERIVEVDNKKLKEEKQQLELESEKDPCNSPPTRKITYEDYKCLIPNVHGDSVDGLVLQNNLLGSFREHLRMNSGLSYERMKVFRRSATNEFNDY